MSPLVCPPPEPDCPLYDQRLEGREAEALRRAVLRDLHHSAPSLRDLIRSEATQAWPSPPLLLPAPEPVPPLPLPINQPAKRRTP